jgi:hypothetical protein
MRVGVLTAAVDSREKLCKVSASRKAFERRQHEIVRDRVVGASSAGREPAEEASRYGEQARMRRDDRQSLNDRR